MPFRFSKSLVRKCKGPLEWGNFNSLSTTRYFLGRTFCSCVTYMKCREESGSLEKFLYHLGHPEKCVGNLQLKRVCNEHLLISNLTSPTRKLSNCTCFHLFCLWEMIPATSFLERIRQEGRNVFLWAKKEKLVLNLTQAFQVQCLASLENFRKWKMMI